MRTITKITVTPTGKQTPLFAVYRPFSIKKYGNEQEQNEPLLIFADSKTNALSLVNDTFTVEISDEHHLVFRCCGRPKYEYET